MIYTITFNPSIHILLNVRGLTLDTSIQASSQEVRYGDAGIDISRELNALGRQNTAWGFLAGPMGRMMDDSLVAEGVQGQFVMLPEGETRLNVELRDAGIPGIGGLGSSTVVGQGVGPVADKVSQLQLFSMLQSTRDGDMLIVSGDVPGNVSPHAYARIIESQKDKRVPVVLEAEGDLLLNALQHRPFLVKANVNDVAELMECDPNDRDGLVQGAHLLHELGAQNVLISRGAAGVIFLDEEGILRESGTTARSFTADTEIESSSGVAAGGLGQSVTADNLGQAVATGSLGLGVADANRGLGVADANRGLGVADANRGLGVADANRASNIVADNPESIATVDYSAPHTTSDKPRTDAALLAGFVHGYLLAREEGKELDVVYDRAFSCASSA